MSDPQPVDGVTMRPAEPHEAALVRDIDNRVFPEVSADLQRAAPGELEDGVDAKHVYLVERDQRVAGYLHVDRTDPRWIYISGLAVLPDLQNNGIGNAVFELARPLFEEHEDSLPIYAVTSPRNARMLGILFSLDFAVRWVLPDFFGPGKHRFGCQLLRRGSRLRQPGAPAQPDPPTQPSASSMPGQPAGPRHLPGLRQAGLADLAGLHRLVSSGWTICGQSAGPDGPVFTLAPCGEDDFLPCPPPSASHP